MCPTIAIRHLLASYLMLVVISEKASFGAQLTSGQGWRFREAVVRAQCEAACLDKVRVYVICVCGGVRRGDYGYAAA